MRNFLFFLGTVPLYFFLILPDNAIPASPGISIADTRIIEGNTGQTTVDVMISISPAATSPVTVSYNTKNGTAVNTDYVTSEGSVSFEKGETVKWIKIQVVGETICEQDEKFEITLSNLSAATIADGTGIVTIVNDDCILSSLGISDPAVIQKAKVYEVRLTHTGFTTFFTGPGDCPIRSTGVVILTGLLFGIEDVSGDDDIEYRGTLHLTMDMDLCSVKREGGEDKLCGMRVIGSGPVEAILKINYDQRGGYIKFENKGGPFLRSVTGTCDIPQMDEEETMIPNRTMASIFNGRDLPMLINRTLSVGRLVEDDGEGNVTVVEVLREIKLK